MLLNFVNDKFNIDNMILFNFDILYDSKFNKNDHYYSNEYILFKEFVETRFGENSIIEYQQNDFKTIPTSDINFKLSELINFVRSKSI